MKHIKLFETFNDHVIRMELKKRAKERAEKKKASINSIEIPDEEIKDILIKVKSKKYDVLHNMDKMKKLQKLGLVKSPNAIQTASSFGFPFYITAKGEKFIK